MKRTILSQVLRTSVHENQENLDFVEKLSIKQLVLVQFQILEAFKNNQVL